MTGYEILVDELEKSMTAEDREKERYHFCGNTAASGRISDAFCI